MRTRHEFTDENGEAITIDFTQPSSLRKLVNIIKEKLI